jgi:two-component system OmpR family sensor kinase
MKLRARLTLAVAGVTAAALIASFAVVLFGVRRDETRDLDLALAVQAHDTAQLVLARDPRHPLALDGAAKVPESLAPTVRYIAVYDDAGRVVSATRSFGGPAPSLESLGVAAPVPPEGVPLNLVAQGAALRGVVVPLGEQGQTLLYAASQRTVDEDTRFLYQLLTALFVITTIVTSLVARWLGGLLARDVDAIATVARSVAQGALDARVGEGVRGSAETKALATDLNHMIERLGALMEAQRTFVSHAAHELRSPLATIRGELQLALRRPREASEYRQAIEDVLADVDLLSSLSEDLLTLARVEAVGPAEQAAAIGDVVGDALRMARGPAEARSVVLKEAEVVDGARALHVKGPRNELARVLRNLIDNAIAHSPSGCVVTVEVAQQGACVQVRVIDQGPGISAADTPHIFAPFFRGSKDRSGDAVGAGLGLSIARGIARRYGGDVFLDPTRSSGTCFVLEVPICETI